MLDHLLYFGLGFITATALLSFIVFFWLKKRWQSLLLGFGAKLFTKGMNKVAARRSAPSPPENFREVGRQ